MFIKRKILKQFHYLVSDFGYKVVERSSSGMTIYVKFHSNNCDIYVYAEGSFVSLSVIPTDILGFKDEESKTFEIRHLLDYLAPDLHFKYNESSNINKELKRIAALFLEYCKDVIKGDFSIWPALDRKWNRTV